MRTRGLKHGFDTRHRPIYTVASHADAWIETVDIGCIMVFIAKSRPMRTRGLKLLLLVAVGYFVGGRVPCGRVD